MTFEIVVAILAIILFLTVFTASACYVGVKAIKESWNEPDWEDEKRPTKVAALIDPCQKN